MKNAGLHIVSAFFLCITVWFSSCKPRHICPAYQSAFYLDQKAAALEFTPFDKDTLPKLEKLVRKTDVLLIVRLGKKKIENRMAIIPMITIYPEIDSAALALSDSMANDSLAADDMVPEEEDDLVTDSTQTEEEAAEEESGEEPAMEEEDNPREKADEEEAAAEEESKAEEKPVENEEKAGRTGKKKERKKAAKDPELSDPGLKFEFEESFDDSIPTDEFQNPVMEEEEEDIPLPKNDNNRKVLPNQDGDIPKEEEEEPADDDKF